MKQKMELSQQINEGGGLGSSVRAGSSQNGSGTYLKSDTPLTQPHSGFVLEARRDMIALRVKHGADSPIGHRCSNIIEMLKNGVNPGKQLVELWSLVRAARR